MKKSWSGVALIALCTAVPSFAADDTLPTSRPLGALLGQSTLAFNGWPTPNGIDGPCGKAVGYWRVLYVFKGDKGLKDKVVPIYGQLPPERGARTTTLFLKGPAACPEFVTQQEVGADSIVRSSQKPDDCYLQLQVINRLLGGLATDCEADDECEAFSLHPNSCERPHPYARRAKTSLPAFWPALAGRASQACGPEWSKHPACAPVVMTAHCHEHKCVEGPAMAKLPSFARATVSETCAPHDGPAMAVTARPQGSEYPTLSVSWWKGELPQRGKAGSFELQGATGYNEGFGANYCPTAQGCQLVRLVKMRLKLGADGKGELEIEAETKNGEKFNVKVPAEFGPASRVFCG